MQLTQPECAQGCCQLLILLLPVQKGCALLTVSYVQACQPRKVSETTGSCWRQSRFRYHYQSGKLLMDTSVPGTADEVGGRKVLAFQVVQDLTKPVLVREAKPSVTCASIQQHHSERWPLRQTGMLLEVKRGRSLPMGS